jgi:hypothetical protein
MPEKEFSADDVLRGAAQIAAFLYGPDKAQSKRRRVYDLVERRLLPCFFDGSVICARKSSLIEYIRRQESETSSAQAIAKRHGVAA